MRHSHDNDEARRRLQNDGPSVVLEVTDQDAI